MTPSLVIPVTHQSAHAWAQGWIGDVDLMLGDHPDGQALYIQTLPDLDAWRLVLPELIAQARKGANGVILRTNTPAVVHHVTKWGAVATIQDPSGRWRYQAGPSAVGRYFGRISQNVAASAGVTSSR